MPSNKSENGFRPPLSFSDLGLAQWTVERCKAMAIKTPTPVQQHCIPKILSGNDVIGIAQTGTGKTAAFALPILHRLSEDPFGVFALVMTPTRELADQLADQFRALGFCINLRCTVIVGGENMPAQAKALTWRPHVVIATPGRLKALLEDDPDVSAAFTRLRFLVLDEADRMLNVGFEDELRVVFNSIPKSRQTLLFSATSTPDLRALLRVSANTAYLYEAYEGIRTVDTLKQMYVFVPKSVRDVYLFHVLSTVRDSGGVRSAIVFVSTCRTCEQLRLMLVELDVDAAALHSMESLTLRRAALSRFKSRKVGVLIATDVAARGLDIPTVDLVVNYNVPMDAKDYVHRVGRTARVGRPGLALSLVTENDVELVHNIEDEIGNKLEMFECKEGDVVKEITKVYTARRVAVMNMIDDGFEDKLKARKAQKSRNPRRKKPRL